MAVTVAKRAQTYERVAGEVVSVRQRYVILSDRAVNNGVFTDDIEPYQELVDFIDDTYDGLPIREITVEEVEGGRTYNGEVLYRGDERNFSGDDSYTFETTGGTQHITNSLATVGSYASLGTPIDYGGAIGVSKDAIEGVDIVVPIFQFSYGFRFPGSQVDEAYKTTLHDLTGTVNNALFKNRAAGEVLFLGASGSADSSLQWLITFRFAASKNKTGLVIGDITGINKKGWEYLWVRYEDFADSGASLVGKRPQAVYVEQVYEYTDFSQINIGV